MPRDGDSSALARSVSEIGGWGGAGGGQGLVGGRGWWGAGAGAGGGRLEDPESLLRWSGREPVLRIILHTPKSHTQKKLTI